MVRADGPALAALPVAESATVPLWCIIASAKSFPRNVRFVKVWKFQGIDTLPMSAWNIRSMPVLVFKL